LELKNKTVLITGASSGIGKALAKKFSSRGCNLILISRRKDLLDKLKDEINPSAETVITLQCDVTRKDEVVKVFEKIRQEKLKIDIAVLNAGVSYRMYVEDYHSEFASNVFNTNLLGVIYFVEQLLPDLIERKDGIIAGISSLSDNRGYSGSGFYCASKAALSIYLEALRVELKSYGIKVITVKPGFVKTAMTDKNKFPMPFMISTDKAANIIVGGIQKEKRIIQFPLPIVLLSRFIGLLPAGIYEFFASLLNFKYR